jgi:5-formyltetrahydrofolate cyclo-ligase
MNKNALRQQFLHTRLALDKEERISCTDRATHFLASLLTDLTPQCCALYHPIKSEMSPLGVYALLPDINWALPVITEQGMVFRRWHPEGETLQGAYQISEPVDTKMCTPDIIITPLLAADRQGYRLGYGKGYYDRYFAAHPQAIRIGFGFHLQYCEALPYETHDMTLHRLVTEQSIIEF